LTTTKEATGSPIRVLVVSTSYPETPRDWRGRFIADMVQHLAERPDLEVSLWAPPGDRPDNVVDACTGEDRLWLSELSRRGGIAQRLRSGGIAAVGAAGGLLRRLHRAYRRDPTIGVAHVNWLQNALPLWRTRIPAMVTVLGSDFGMLRLPGMGAALRSVFRQRRCVLAPNAEWMAEPLRRAFGTVATVTPIPFGIADPWFSIGRRSEGSRKWVAVARVTRAKLGTLLEWGNGRFSGSRELHLFGPMQEQVALPDWVVYHGAADPEQLKERWFPEACGLVTLSSHDEGRPQVVLEAMAAGVPVLVSDLPAHRDVVAHGKTGWIATDPASFEEGLRQLENPATNERIAREARHWARTAIGTWADCAERYAHAYATLRAAPAIVPSSADG
jgi:hypothetical protein